jgi:predicted transcriptional regulator
LNDETLRLALKKKGFVLSDGDHRFFTYYTVAGRKTSVWTKTSFGTAYKTLGDDLVSKMAKQCGLTTKQFKELVGCSLTRDKIESILLESGRIA